MSRYASALKKMAVVAVMIVAVIGCGPRKAAQPEPVAVAPPPPPPLVHRVAYSGETLGLIARWYTGSVENWTKIHEANPGLDVNRIQIGSDIYIPHELVTRTEPMPKSAVPVAAAVPADDSAADSENAKTEAPELQDVAAAAPAVDEEDQQSAEPAAEPIVDQPVEALEERAAAEQPEPAADDQPAEAPAAEQTGGEEEGVQLKTREDFLKELLKESMK